MCYRIHWSTFQWQISTQKSTETNLLAQNMNLYLRIHSQRNQNTDGKQRLCNERPVLAYSSLTNARSSLWGRCLQPLTTAAPGLHRQRHALQNRPSDPGGSTHANSLSEQQLTHPPRKHGTRKQRNRARVKWKHRPSFPSERGDTWGGLDALLSPDSIPPPHTAPAAGGRADGARRRWTPRLSLPAPSGAAGPRRNPSAWRKRRSEGSGKQAARTERSRRRWARPRPTVPGRAAQRAGRLRAPTPALPRGPSAPRLSPTASDPRPAPPQLSDPAPPHGPAPPHRPGCPRASRRPGSAAAARRSSTARRAGPGPQRHLPAPARRSAEEPRFRGRARLQPASAPPHPSHRPSCSPAPGGGRGGAPQREGGKNGAAINVQTDWECAPAAGTAEKDTAPQECFMTLFILRNYWDSEAPKRSIIPKAEGRFHFPYSCCFAFFQKHVQGGI